MESSQFFGGRREECHSSESGWTLYLGSSIQDGGDDDNNETDPRERNYGKSKNNYYQEDDSDDSMASDASSGPSHQGISSHFKNDDDDEEEENDGKYHFERTKHIKEKKKTERFWRNNGKEAEVGSLARKANNNNNNNNNNIGINAFPAQSGSKQKVRKSISWMGKRK